MDITDKILAQLHADNQSDRLSISDLVREFQSDVLWLDSGNMTEVESQLMASQYAYIKFGLVLEKVRNQCMWKKCIQKFSDFRHFCQGVVNLNIWQANNAIDSAKVALKLLSLGFTDLPRNASQALKLAKLSIERLGEVWESILKANDPHKITADIIAMAIDPNLVEVEKETTKLPKALLEKAKKAAAKQGLSVEEYLDHLIDADCDEGQIAPDRIEITPEDEAALDRLESQWKPEPKKFLETVSDGFDDFMNGLIGEFVPTPTKSCYPLKS